MSYTLKNSVEISGRAGADAITKFTPTGKAVTTFDIATGGGKRTNGGEWPTHWFTVKAWNNEQAQEVKKGYRVDIEGRIETEEWKDKASGSNRRKVVIVAKTVDLSIDRRDDIPATPPTAVPTKSEFITDDDIPF